MLAFSRVRVGVFNTDEKFLGTRISKTVKHDITFHSLSSVTFYVVFQFCNNATIEPSSINLGALHLTRPIDNRSLIAFAFFKSQLSQGLRLLVIFNGIRSCLIYRR